MSTASGVVEALLAAIAADPEAAAARLVLADYCDGHEMPATAAFLRAQEAHVALSARSKLREASKALLVGLADAVDPTLLAKIDRASRYTLYWSADQLARVKAAGFDGAALDWVWGGWNRNSDMQRVGVVPGDWLYPIHVLDKQLYVLNRLRIRAWEQSSFAGPRPVDAPPVVRPPQVGRCTGETVALRAAPPEVVAGMTFRPRTGKERALKGVEGGRVSQAMGLQGVFRLSPRSAYALDALF